MKREFDEKQDMWRVLEKLWSFNKKGSTDVLSGIAKKIAERKKKEAEQAWNRVVHDETLAQAVIDTARRVQEELPDGEFPPALSSLIRETRVDWGQSKVVCPPVSLTPLAVAHTLPAKAPEKISPAMEAFAKVWPLWVKSDEFPEAEETAASAFRSVCKTRPVEEVVKACLYYVRCITEELEEIEPHSMRWFLLNESKVSPPFCQWEIYLYRAQRAPSEQDVKDFQVAWALYPDFRGKDRARKVNESRKKFAKTVPVEDRFKFLCAIREYRGQRKDSTYDDEEREQYTQSFVTFLETWRSVPWQNRASRFLIRFLYPKVAPFDTMGSHLSSCEWGRGAIKSWMRIGKTPEFAVSTVLRQMWIDRNAESEFKESDVQEILQAAYQAASALPQNVLSSV